MKFISESKATSSVIPTAVSSAHAALLRQINRTERFQVFAKNQLNKNSKIETFLSLLFESTTKIIRNYRPEQSIAIIYLQCEVYFRFTERIRIGFQWFLQPFLANPGKLIHIFFRRRDIDRFQFFSVFRGVTKTDFWKTHPQKFDEYLFSFCKISGYESDSYPFLDEFYRNRSVSRPGICSISFFD